MKETIKKLQEEIQECKRVLARWDQREDFNYDPEDYGFREGKVNALEFAISLIKEEVFNQQGFITPRHNNIRKEQHG